jgi:hypothetical protein
MTEANQQATANKSQIAEDEQRRNLAARSVGAQESAAAAAWRAFSPFHARGSAIQRTVIGPATDGDMIATVANITVVFALPCGSAHPMFTFNFLLCATV